MVNTLKLPVGIDSFEKIRRNGFLATLGMTSMLNLSLRGARARRSILWIDRRGLACGQTWKPKGLPTSRAMWQSVSCPA